MSLSSLHHIAVCPQMAVLPVYLFKFWNKSLEKLGLSPVSEGFECRPHLRWLWDRLLWRRNTKCPNVEDFLWRCSNQRAESFSYALWKRDLKVWASEQGQVRRQLGPLSYGHILNGSAAPSHRSWSVWRPPLHGASVSFVDVSALASLGPCWLWMFCPSAPFRNCCILLYLICMLLSSLCKEIEENNGVGKTRDLFKKIRDTKGTFHAKMGLIKDRIMDLIEAEDIKKRWQEYKEELYKRDLNEYG